MWTFVIGVKLVQPATRQLFPWNMLHSPTFSERSLKCSGNHILKWPTLVCATSHLSKSASYYVMTRIMGHGNGLPISLPS